MADKLMPKLKVIMVSQNESMPPWVEKRLADHGIELTERMCQNGQDVLDCAADADVIWVNNGSRCVSAEAVRSLPRCRVILRTGAGTDNIPVDVATQEGIMVAHTPDAVASPPRWPSMRLPCFWRSSGASHTSIASSEKVIGTNSEKWAALPGHCWNGPRWG